MCIGGEDVVQFLKLTQKKAITAYRGFSFSYDDNCNRTGLSSVAQHYDYKRGVNSTMDDPADGPNLGFHSLASLFRAKQQGSVWASVKVWGTVAVIRSRNGRIIGYRSTHIKIEKVLGGYIHNRSDMAMLKHRYEKSAA